MHFVLKWGVGIFSAVFLVCAVASTFLSNWLFNRRMAQAGMHIELRLADLVPFIPRLLVLVVGGGVVFAIVMWFYMEAAYRRAQSSARA